MNKITRYIAMAGLALVAALVINPVSAQPTDREMCPPSCGVTIDVPGNPGLEPNSWPVTLVAEVGERVTFSTNVRSRVVFTGRTPFIDDRGNRVFNFVVDGQTSLQIADSHDCSDEPGCKYMIIDLTDPGRPARDPYIVVPRR